MENSNKNRILSAAIIIAGVYLLVSSVFLYRYTVIPGYLILVLLLTPGLLLTPVFINKVNKITGQKTHWAMQYVLHTISSGSLVLFIFLAINFLSAQNKSTHSYVADDIKTIAGSHGQSDKQISYTVIKNGEIEKTIPYFKATTEKIKISEGLLGFDVISHP
ncbi:MAG: hypothetical protein A2W91_10215 [Bacteroidetes bacterium GWF2_38_335]|nr:MAG: hypothetical protein A2W91_10215 [Bacteroidetes bacterium GWF2_38_335]HBS88001.1 hypothetical protein [Bacteroidales bacterium]